MLYLYLFFQRSSCTRKSKISDFPDFHKSLFWPFCGSFHFSYLSSHFTSRVKNLSNLNKNYDYSIKLFLKGKVPSQIFENAQFLHMADTVRTYILLCILYQYILSRSLLRYSSVNTYYVANF